MRNSINDEKVKAKLSESDRKALEAAVDEALHWLEEHHGAEKEEFEEKQKQLEGKVNVSYSLLLLHHSPQQFSASPACSPS